MLTVHAPLSCLLRAGRPAVIALAPRSCEIERKGVCACGDFPCCKYKAMLPRL